MLSRSTSQSVCKRCLCESQLASARRSHSAQSRWRTRIIRPQQCSSSRTDRRFFSNTSLRLTSDKTNDPDIQNSISGHDAGHEEAVLASQAAMLELLEKKLGKPLEQAIKEDEISAETAAKFIVEAAEANLGISTDQGPTDAISRLRSAGATSADIAREARQIHGDVLPEEILNKEELSMYKRLYGDPASMRAADQEEDRAVPRHELYASTGEQIEYSPDHEAGTSTDSANEVQSQSPANLDLARTRAMEVAQSLHGSVVEGEEFEDDDEDIEFSESDRGHSLTAMGKFKTTPKTLFLPQEALVRPVEQIMSSYSNKHLNETCERVFGGPGLPDSALTPRSGRSRKQVAIPLDVNQNSMSEMEANAFITTIMPPTYASIISVLTETRKRLGTSWLTKLLAKEGGPRILDAGAGGAGIIAWREIVQAHWNSLHTPDKASNPPPPSKSVVLTGADTLRHRAAALLENTTFIPRLPDYVNTRQRPTLEDDRPAQQRKQFDVIIAPHVLFGLKEDWMRKQHVQNLWSLLSDEGGVLVLIEKGVPRGFEAIAEVREMLLDRHIAIPEGHTTRYSRGDHLLLNEDEVHKKTTAMIVAPCTNHERCPMYTTPGLSRGRRDICSFQQRYIRPPFLQRVLGAKDRNHDDVDFSYLSVIKGDDLRLRNVSSWDHLRDPLSAPLAESQPEQSSSKQSLVNDIRTGFEDVMLDADGHSEQRSQDDQNPKSLPSLQQMPRIVFSPLKRRGHVTMDLCTPTGHIERWTIPRSFSRQAYRDARKSKWGDLWALGAKTHVSRNLQLGTPGKELFDKDGEVIKGKGRGTKERMRIKAQEMLERHEEQRAEDLMEQRDMIAALDEEFGTKASRHDISMDAIQSRMKPTNNKERKAARRAERAVAQSTGTTQPTESESLSQSDMEHEMSEWQAEYEHFARPGKGKKGGAYEKFGSSTSAAKKAQKNRDKSGEFVRK